MKLNQSIGLALLVPTALTVSGCYLTFDEGLQETDVYGKVVIEAELAGVSSFGDLSEEELHQFVNELGMVYVGAWSGLTQPQTAVVPSFDPFSHNAFPYGGATVGGYAYAGLDYLLDCQMISGRFYDMQNILDHYDIRIAPGGIYQSRYLDYQTALEDGLIDADEAAALTASSTYPKLTEQEYTVSLLEDEYFRFYLEGPTAGCQTDEDGNLLLETCEVSDFDFYGKVPWTINADGDLEAPFVMYKVSVPTNESGETVYPLLWAWADQSGSTCDGTAGQYTSVPYADTLNFPCQFLRAGDLVSNYADASAAPRVSADGAEVEVRIAARVAALPEESLVDENGDEYAFPYCGY